MTFKCQLPLESSVYQLEKVKFLVGEEAKNDFKVTFDNLYHSLFSFFQIIFWCSRMVQNKLEGDMRALETSLFRPQPIRVLGWSRCQK